MAVYSNYKKAEKKLNRCHYSNCILALWIKGTAVLHLHILSVCRLVTRQTSDLRNQLTKKHHHRKVLTLCCRFVTLFMHIFDGIYIALRTNKATADVPHSCECRLPDGPRKNCPHTDSGSQAVRPKASRTACPSVGWLCHNTTIAATGCDGT